MQAHTGSRDILFTAPGRTLGAMQVYESTYEEFTVTAAAHPIHIHVNPMQVQTDNDEWNVPGDWMDVIFSNGVYRQHLADHAGTVIVHCHWLSHEDLGCMSQFTSECKAGLPP